MTNTETLKLALEALEQYASHRMGSDFGRKAITALRTAIAEAEKQEPTGKQSLQVEQEPVAWMDEFGNVFPLGAQRGPKYLNEPMKPLYTTPPAAQRQWVGLTDGDFENAFQETYIMGDSDLQDFAKVIEAKLKEKNT